MLRGQEFFCWARPGAGHVPQGSVGISAIRYGLNFCAEKVRFEEENSDFREFRSIVLKNTCYFIGISES
jgi:hypothetical protein